MAAAASDLNLLFGMLALQLDFINKEQLIAGMQAWVNCKTKSLGRTLVEQGALAADQHQLLNTLVKKHLETHGNNAQQSLAALNVNPAAREALKPIKDVDLHASLVRIPGPRVPQPPAPPAPPPGGAAAAGQYATISPSSAGPGAKENASRYRILRPHAKGGLGVVFVARDEEIGREVALKEIQIQFTRDADSRSRFVLEAEITGGLEHPGIVPVYGLGHYPDGRPYYAMRFIRGDSLKEAVDRFHAQDVTPGRDAHERNLSFRQLLRRFGDVCDAIEYAHSKGVLHRDLKPGNIMLGKFGETLVVDWGLAKAMGKTESPSMASIHLNEAPLTPSIRNDTAQTQMGAAIGTPAFMSPEQAAGRLDLLGPASDIYSLGATLYYLLTGQPSMMSSDLAEVLNNVQKGVFPKPREIKPKIPKPLEAICLKAMALEVPDRYASAFELKTEIEHYMDDLPVKAWPEPFTVRARRWLNRHRALATSTVAAVLVAAISLGVATVLLSKANEDLTASEAREKAEKLTAKLNEDRALIGEAEALKQKAAADQATSKATEARDFAEKQKRLAEARVYAANLALAMAAWQEGNAELAYKYLGDARQDALRMQGAAGQKEALDWEFRYVFSLVNKGQKTFEGHNDSVNGVAFSGDSQEVVTGGEDGKLILWNVKTGEPIRHFEMDGKKDQGIRPAVKCVAFSPDGTRIISGHADKAVRLWNAKTGALLGKRANHTDAVTCVAFSRDGKLAASGSDDKTLRIWTVEKGEILQTLKPNQGSIKSVAFSPSGDRIVGSTAQSNAPIVWDRETGKELFTLKGHVGFVWSVAFSPDGKFIVTGGDRGAFVDDVDVEDCTVRVWDAATGQPLQVLKGHKDYVSSVAVSPDGKRIVSGSDDRTVKIWDVENGAALFTMKGHKQGITCVAISPDGQSIATGGTTQADKQMKIWTAPYSQETVTLKSGTDPVNQVSPGFGGRRFVSAGKDGSLKVWDAADGKTLFELKGHGGPVLSAAMSGDGKVVASGGEDRTVKLWDAMTGKPSRTLNGHTDRVNCVAISGNRIASGSDDRSIKIWDGPAGSCTMTLTGHAGPVTSVAFSDDGQFLVSGSADKSVRIWNAGDGKELVKLDGHGAPVLSVTFSDDGKSIVSGGKDKTVVLWDIKSRKAVRDFLGHTAAVNSVAISRDNRRIISGSDDKSIRMWNPENGQETLTLKEHIGPVLSVAFNSSDLQILSGSADGTIKIWDATNGLSATRSK